MIPLASRESLSFPYITTYHVISQNMKSDKKIIQTNAYKDSYCYTTTMLW